MRFICLSDSGDTFFAISYLLSEGVKFPDAIFSS